MDDAAKTWVSPFCSVYEGPPPQSPGIQVWVLNPGGPGAGSAQVTVRIYEIAGALFGTDTKTVEPMNTVIFNTPQVLNGWCHIQSDKPVFPWGLTAWLNGDEQGVIDMSFYRHEPILPIIQGLGGLISSAFKR